MKKNQTNKWIDVEGRVNLSGVQYGDYQLVCGGLKPGTVLQLVGEPSNKFDPKAVRVQYNGIKLGYLPRHSIQQSEVWNAHSRGSKCIAVVTAFNKTNPTWMMITVQVKKTQSVKDKQPNEVKF